MITRGNGETRVYWLMGLGRKETQTVIKLGDVKEMGFFCVFLEDYCS